MSALNSPVLHSCGPAQILGCWFVPVCLLSALKNKVHLVWHNKMVKKKNIESMNKSIILQNNIKEGLSTAKFHAVCMIPIFGTVKALDLPDPKKIKLIKELK